MTDQRWLHYVAERLRTEPGVLGYLLARYQELSGISREDLVRELDASAEAMDVLARCGLPRRQHFFADVARIAERAGVSGPALGKICGQMLKCRPDLWPDAPQRGQQEEVAPGRKRPTFSPAGRLPTVNAWMAAARRAWDEERTEDGPTEGQRAEKLARPKPPKDTTSLEEG